MPARKGFTLVEVLVTLVLLGLLIGVVLPAVVNQMDKGDHTRVASDLEAIRTGSRLFRVEVKRYPASLEQLSEAPGAAAAGWDTKTDLGGGTINQALLDRWDGPYLEGAAAADSTFAASAMESALGAEIHPLFTVEGTLGGVPYLTVKVVGLQASDIVAISEIIDADPDVTMTDAGGRIRNTLVGDTMYYLAIPVN